MYYVLDERGEPVPEPDILKAAVFFEQHERRRVGDTRVGPYRVSTVFLGMDHGYGQGPPVLWETMIFAEDLKEGEASPDYQNRYTSRADAVAGHEAVVEWVRRGLPPGEEPG